MAEKITMARILFTAWDHIMRAAVREGTEIGHSLSLQGLA